MRGAAFAAAAVPVLEALDSAAVSYRLVLCKADEIGPAELAAGSTL